MAQRERIKCFIHRGKWSGNVFWTQQREGGRIKSICLEVKSRLLILCNSLSHIACLLDGKVEVDLQLYCAAEGGNTNLWLHILFYNFTAPNSYVQYFTTFLMPRM